MAADPATLGCRLPGCSGPRSGVCINSLPFEECPDVVPFEGGDEAQERPADLNEQAVALPGGRNLDAASCDALLRERGGTVVGLVASPDAGKTTLVATIYEMLHRRRMAAFGFAGSETLRGYEERCYLARLSSNAARPDTQRTPRGLGVTFTHLRVAAPGGLRDVMFSDRSGEHFEDALARPAEIGGFPELRRANMVALLVDLARLVRDTHVTVSHARRLFMAMDQGGLLDGKKVLLVGTKADLAIPNPRSMKAQRELAAVGDELDRRAAGRFATGRHVIACHARRGSTVIGDGVEPLLAELLARPPMRPRRPDDSWPGERSELDNLMRGYRSTRP